MRPREASLATEDALAAEATKLARPLRSPDDMRRLAGRIAEARIVMLGEASHGTHEFYEFRAQLSKELIENHGFQFIAVEGDWPPCWKLNNFIHGQGGDYARDALKSFQRWPTWMWANEETAELADWMRSWNEHAQPEERVSFYGLDVYSFFESIEAVLSQVERINPFLANRLRSRYACLEPFQRDERAYARSLLKYPDGCEKEITQNLKDLLEQRLDETFALPHRDALFNARQNARIVKNAESYYSTMVHGTEDSWNVRDRHMLETLQVLLARHGGGFSGNYSKCIVWAHNTHIGDYIATDMPRYGQVNLGGLARETFGRNEVSLVGFGTFEGSVIASHAWDGPVESLRVPRGRAGSVEAAFHKTCLAIGENSFELDLTGSAKGPLAEIHGHRAIGVVYHPESEHHGNYVPTSLSRRYDSFVFFDKTSGVTPLQQPFLRNEIPETWPQGM